MAMGGGGPPPTPDPEPIPQVPVKESPGARETERQVVNRARKQQGYSKHLLTGAEGDTSVSGVQRKRLIG